MDTLRTPHPQAIGAMNTQDLRKAFLIESLFVPGALRMVYTDLDRGIVGAVVPTTESLALVGGRELASDYFCQRREVGILNLGAAGSVRVDGQTFDLAARECLYIGRGAKNVDFSSANPQEPAMFYLVSYPAHAVYPTRKAGLSEARRVELGTLADANRRTIFQYIHQEGIPSCQLVMGFTQLHEGSVWNTFPPHTHDRRTEIYCYFDLAKNGLVMHFLGEPTQTRHLVMREKQVALSPSWSIHSGAGTGAYAFVWAMGGENQVFNDMDFCDMSKFQ